MDSFHFERFIDQIFEARIYFSLAFCAFRAFSLYQKRNAKMKFLFLTGRGGYSEKKV